MFAYCLNNPINLSDFSGYIPVTVNGKNVPIPRRSLPRTGKPNSSDTLYNPDGTPKQKRWYDENGNAERDRDYNHSGDEPFPHDHEWKDGKRNPEHSPPSPDYEFSGNMLLGTGLIVIGVVGIVWLTANDVTGVGAADDGLIIPLIQLFSEGSKMIFK